MEEVEGIVQFSEWQKLDLRTAKILKAEEIEGADKLYKLEIDLGFEKRTLVAGLKPYYSQEELENKNIIVFTNLAPRTIRGVESKGMILAASNEGHEKVRLLQTDSDIEFGSRIS
ncbi:methionine--tRNA ligase subunit beta [Candidatus Pacearchaeota archaeon]|nr:methionine--tRNA ligase subunit beta [Candidatus Pacearchaeota archaeon]